MSKRDTRDQQKCVQGVKAHQIIVKIRACTMYMGWEGGYPTSEDGVRQKWEVCLKATNSSGLPVLCFLV